MLEQRVPRGWVLRRELGEREQRCSNGRRTQELAWGRAQSPTAPIAMSGAGELLPVCAEEKEQAASGFGVNIVMKK